MSKRTSNSIKRRPGNPSFVKGCPSPNPSGRPRGIQDRRVQLRALLEPHKERLIQKVVSLALGGDVSALKLCLERLVPVLRPISEPVQIDNIPNGLSLSEQAKAIFTETIAGRIPTDDAARLLELITGQVKIIELTSLFERVERLEKNVKTREGKPNDHNENEN